MVKLILLFGFSMSAYSAPFLITSGQIVSTTMGQENWSLSGTGGFFAAGVDVDVAVNYCDCAFPFQLVQPLYVLLTLHSSFGFGAYSYSNGIFLVPSTGFGSVNISPQVPLPIVTEPGLYEVPYNVDASFCGTDPAPQPQRCFSAVGTAIAHYEVSSAGTSFPNFGIQPPPTLDISVQDTPEPGTLGAGTLFILVILAGRTRRSRFRTLLRPHAPAPARHSPSDSPD